MPHNQLAPQAITRGLKRAAIDKRKGQEAAVAQQICESTTAWRMEASSIEVEEAQSLCASVAHPNGQTNFAAPKTATAPGSITSFLSPLYTNHVYLYLYGA